MKINIRKLLFTSALIIVLVAISIVCFIIGRGHTVYFDNMKLSGSNYDAYESIEVSYDGKKIATLNKDERTSLTLTGQKLKVTLVVKKSQTSSKETIDMTIALPYDLDGIVINVPALLEGAEQDVYLSEYVSAVSEEEVGDEDVPVTDEFGMTTDE